MTFPSQIVSYRKKANSSTAYVIVATACHSYLLVSKPTSLRPLLAQPARQLRKATLARRMKSRVALKHPSQPYTRRLPSRCDLSRRMSIAALCRPPTLLQSASLPRRLTALFPSTASPFPSSTSPDCSGACHTATFRQKQHRFRRPVKTLPDAICAPNRRLQCETLAPFPLLPICRRRRHQPQRGWPQPPRTTRSHPTSPLTPPTITTCSRPTRRLCVAPVCRTGNPRLTSRTSARLVALAYALTISSLAPRTSLLPLLLLLHPFLLFPQRQRCLTYV